MLTRSTKSVVSIKSFDIEIVDEQEKSFTGLPCRIFEELLPYICKKFRCTFDVVVRKDYIHDPMNRYKLIENTIKRKKVGVINTTLAQPKKNDDKISDDGQSTTTYESDKSFCDHNLISITSLYDNNKELVELLFYKLHLIPRRLIQAIGVIAPLYELLTKITIRRCIMDMYTIYELNKIVSKMFITDMCFDDSSLAEANYAILLETSSNLRQLSLSRCQINDVVVGTIATKLHFLRPAEKHLLILNMSSNFITDVGAKYIGEMLRSNRNLRYLNLAGNSITDEGASHILDAFTEFPLTSEEISDKRRRIINYLRIKKELVVKLLTECDLAFSFASSKESVMGSAGKRTSKHKRSGSSLSGDKVRKYSAKERQVMADSLAIQMLGSLCDPFGPGKTTVKSGWTYCKGNFTLSYLNLSYNYLTRFSLSKVLNVLLYQKNINCESQKCFQKIILEGNYLPEECVEITKINEIIKEKLSMYDKKKSEKLEKERRGSESTRQTI